MKVSLVVSAVVFFVSFVLARYGDLQSGLIKQLVGAGLLLSPILLIVSMLYLILF